MTTKCSVSIFLKQLCSANKWSGKEVCENKNQANIINKGLTRSRLLHSYNLNITDHIEIAIRQEPLRFRSQEHSLRSRSSRDPYSIPDTSDAGHLFRGHQKKTPFGNSSFGVLGRNRTHNNSLGRSSYIHLTTRTCLRGRRTAILTHFIH